MFTGIIHHTGTIDAIERLEAGARILVRTDDREPFVRGESLAVNGVCLTVMPHGDGVLATDVSNETLRRTTLGALRPGTRVNLERAMAVGDRLGGHIVQGHVDGVATLLRRDPGTRSEELHFSLPADLARYVVEKGSITVDGVSLTVAGTDDATFRVALIPTTLAHTTLGSRTVGDTVNLEVDVVAKYVERLTVGYVGAGASDQD